MANKKFYIIFLIFLIAFTSCGLNKDGNKLFQTYTGKPVPDCFNNFKGMGREAFPDFMSWACFKYSCTHDCLTNEFLKDTLLTDKDEQFTLLDCKFFPKDLSFYKEAIDNGFLLKEYSCENKIFIRGIKYPYIHSILYDTMTHNVVHLVSVLRD